MRIITIDPRAGTITEVNVPGQVDWKVIKHYIGGFVTIAGQTPSGDVLWVDYECLLKGPDHFFTWRALNSQPLAGIGVITGPEVDEEITDARIPFEEVRANILFLDRMQATRMDTTTETIGGVSVTTIKPTIEPV